MKQCGIYRIVCLQNLKSYFGSSSDFSARKTQHKQQLNGNRHHNIILQRAWSKYGKDSFVFEFIEEVDEKDLLIREQIYLDMMFDGKNLLGFNISRDAESPTRGLRFSDKTKKKMSESKRGNKNRLGTKTSKETKKKLSVIATGKSKSEEHKKNMRKPKSEEHKKNMRKPKSEEHKKNISKARIEYWKQRKIHEQTI